jgi:hypothetical protein
MFRRMILVLSVVALMAAMMIASAMPAFAAEENKENSCGRAVSEVRTDFDEFNDCGILINPNYVPGGTFPPGKGLYT